MIGRKPCENCGNKDMESCKDMCLLLAQWEDESEIREDERAKVIEECIDTLYEVTPQTIDQKLDMVFVNALRRLKENK